MDNKEQLQEKRNKAYELRLRGKTYREIGKLMGVSHVTAQKWVKAHMEDVTLPLVEEVRKQEVDRLHRYLDRLEERVDDGDDKAISLSIKISERLCKMLGVDMPTQVQVERTEITQVDLAIQDLLSRQAAQNALRKAEAASIRETSSVEVDEPSRRDIESEIEGLL